ncbi:hypothetical protein PENSTE_c017G07071 [Penicillium steckii]|uniref:Uncharacterized protein n=1 Tax=Penicillium steckii TaxID=303698 RepID=A0A1V6SXM8_9EURO|nr:hypothetical protein PENSTE_c017G07071 [Penicillium steckii]
MKPSTVINFIATFGLLGLASAAKLSQAEAEAQCGDLGVMDTSNLPANVDPNDVRTCKEHPEGQAGKTVNQERSGDFEVRTLESRSCWNKNNLGCSAHGYCYKSSGQPGSGEWCWTAKNNGFGSWIGCNTVDDCSEGDGCGAGGCKACGCSC